MESILSIIDTRKKKIRVTILLIVTIVVMTTGMRFAFTDSEIENIKEIFYKSVNYNPDKDLLSFTIPKSIPKGFRFFLHVSGMIFMGDESSGMSIHIFDEESLNYTWKYGKTYSYPLNSEGLDFVSLTFGLIDENKNEVLYTIHVSPDGSKIIEAD